MLTCWDDAFLEVADEEVIALQRSVQAVVFRTRSGDSFETQAFLVLYRQGEEHLCRAALHCRELKRSLIFAVTEADPTELFRHGEAELQRLGFVLTPVNLNLNPALRQVVLRDIPPLRRPAAEEYLPTKLRGGDLFAEGDSPSAISKSAALKLNAQRLLEKKLADLRVAIEQQLQPATVCVAALSNSAGEIEKLAVRCAEAERLAAKAEARQVHVEELLAAAETRIRELEELLISAETRSAEELQFKKKFAELEKRGKELAREAKDAEVRIKAEEQRREALNKVLAACQEQLGRCEEQLQEAAKEHAATLAESEQRHLEEVARSTALEAELAGAQGRISIVSAARDELLGELKAARERHKTLEKELARTREQAAGAAAAAELAGERDRAHTLAGQLEATNNKLQKELTAARKRVDTLAKKLQEAEAASAVAAADQGEAPAALVQTLADLQVERQARASLEEQLDAAHRMLESLEQALKVTKEAGARAGGESAEGRRLRELKAQLDSAETQMEQERIETRKLAKAHAEAQKRVAELEAALQRQAQMQPEPAAALTAEPVEPAPASAKPLPHEVRPEPKPGALFRPDWDLQGLPCRTTDEVVQAWESVYNVQLSLEGYPSQYCSAYLAVLKQGRQKRLYFLFSLKKSKHALVCVPSQLPGDDAALRKVIAEGQKYLKKSGFELEPIAPDQVASVLGGYFLKE